MLSKEIVYAATWTVNIPNEVCLTSPADRAVHEQCKLRHYRTDTGVMKARASLQQTSSRNQTTPMLIYVQRQLPRNTRRDL